VKERATDVVALLPQIEMVKNSKLLSEEQKAVLLSDMTTSLPPEMLCSGFMSTRKIVEEIIAREVANVQPKKAEKKVATKAPQKATKRAKK
jgi:hypothetical protein